MRKPTKAFATATASLSLFVGALLAVPGVAQAAPNSPALRTIACDGSNSFQYFTFYVSGGGPVCYVDSGTMAMHLAPVWSWYSENNSGTFTYITPNNCPPPVVFGHNETGTLPPDAIITSLTIY